MCGIFGFNWDDNSLLVKMSKALEHRGPDNSGKLVDDNVSLGHRRLSIIDISSRGNQPIFNEKKDIAVIFNGEIYNFNELRQVLESKGHKFSTETDTEVIVHSYEEWGTRCPEFFEGIFSFCIYDKNKKKLFLARDPLGVKPLFYQLKKGRFVFCSEVKGILQAELPTSLNLSGLRKFLRFKYLPDSETLFSEIQKVPAAHFAVFDLKTKKLEIKKYWFIHSSSSEKSENTYAAELNNLLKKTVKSQLISDVPLGVYLSGGVDSSIVTSLVKHMDPEAELKTFSVGFSQRTGNNDLEFARIVAEHVGSNHQEFYFESNDVLKYLDKMIWQYDEPIGEAGVIPNYFLSKHVSKRVKVVLAGEGGDEVFGGYDYYQFFKKVSTMNQLVPKPVKWFTRFAVPPPYNQLISLDRQFDMVNNNIIMKVFDKGEIEGLTKGSVEKVKIASEKDIISQDGNIFLYNDVKTLLSECFNTKFDRATMASSIEGRVPLQSPAVVKFAFSVPFKYKYNGNVGKYLLKKVASNYLPRDVVMREKQGFGTPLKEWVHHDFKNEIHNTLRSQRLVKMGVLDGRVVEKILNNGEFLKTWTLFTLERWFSLYREHFENEK